MENMAEKGIDCKVMSKENWQQRKTEASET